MPAIPFDVNDPDVREMLFHRGLAEALAGLRDDARPDWGRMTAQQMVEHLLWAFELSTGEGHAECPIPEAQRERLRAFLYDNRPTPRDYMNPLLAPGLPALRHNGVADAVTSLCPAVTRFVGLLHTAPGATRTHPVFGPIGMEEWGRAHFKHCYHHLLQFGLIETVGCRTDEGGHGERQRREA